MIWSSQTTSPAKAAPAASWRVNPVGHTYDALTYEVTQLAVSMAIWKSPFLAR